MRWPSHDELQTAILGGWLLARAAVQLRSRWQRLRVLHRGRSERRARLREAQRFIDERVDQAARVVSDDVKHQLWAIRSGGDDVA